MVKNKTILTFSILAAAISLTSLMACQPKSPEPKEVKPAQSQTTIPNETLKLTGETEKLSLDLPDCTGNNCPEISISRLATNQPFVDHLMDQEILNQLQQILDISPQPAKNTQDKPVAETTLPNASADQTAASSALERIETPKQKLEQQVTPYLVNFLALDKELKALSSNHKISLMINPKILNPDLPLATVVLNTSSYLGGAHGATSQRYYNFDLAKKKQVKLDDLLMPNQKAILEQRAHEAFKNWVMAAQLADSVEEYEQAWKFSLTDNFYLSPQGLILQYAEYEIGPYVVGLPRLTIPYDQLQTVLKKEYLPQPKVDAAVSASSTAANQTKP